jgi:hypothetical protein
MERLSLNLLFSEDQPPLKGKRPVVFPTRLRLILLFRVRKGAQGQLEALTKGEKSKMRNQKAIDDAAWL